MYADPTGDRGVRKGSPRTGAKRRPVGRSDPLAGGSPHVDQRALAGVDGLETDRVGTRGSRGRELRRGTMTEVLMNKIQVISTGYAEMPMDGRRYRFRVERYRDDDGNEWGRIVDK